MAPHNRSVTQPKPLTAVRTLVVLIGSIGPLGFLPASGTATVAIVGIPLFYLTHAWSDGARIALAAFVALAGVWIHDRGDRWLGEKDSRRLVWDEVAGFLVAILFVPVFTWQLAVVAFLIERTLDILKIQPARWIEDHVPGGWGVVGDDLIAGAYTCAVLHGLLRFAPHAVGVSS